MSSPPDVEDLGGGLIPGEIDISFVTLRLPRDMGKYSPTLEVLVKPEDLVVEWDCTH